jgi:hypothetical protein
MSDILNKLFRRPIWPGTASEWAAPPAEQLDSDDENLLEYLRIDRKPILSCRACGKPAQLELTTDESERTEYLCYEDLGSFLEVFTNPGIREWTIVRLP